MRRLPTADLVLLGLAGLPLAATAAAEEAPVRLNGEPLTPSELADYRQERGGEGPAAGLSDPVAMEELINRRLLVDAARKRDLASQPGVRRALRRARQDILIEALLRRVTAERVTEHEVAQFYGARFGDAEQLRQLRVIRQRTHSRKAAAELRQQLAADGGESSEAEWVFPALQAPALSEALGQAREGSVLGPVASDGDWIVVRVTDRRQVPPPALEAVRGAIRERLEYQAIRDFLGDLRDSATIEYREKPPSGG